MRGSVSRCLLALVLAASTLAACSEDPIAPVYTVTDTGFEVRSQSSTLRLTNRRDAPIFVNVMGRVAADHSNWAPCTDAEVCPPIAPGAVRNVAWPSGIGGEVEYEAVVFWWHAVAAEDGTMQPDSIRAVIIGR